MNLPTPMDFLSLSSRLGSLRDPIAAALSVQSKRMRHLGVLAFCLALSQLLFNPATARAALVDGGLRMEMIAAPNFVVDSNVESPSTNGPSAAHLGVKITNNGATALTNIQVKIGDLTDPATGAGTPGLFPSRNVTVGGSGGYSGTFLLQMPGGAVDAIRTIPRLEAGESVVQYFFVTYPLKDASGNGVAGSAPDPLDDLWLNYDVWATAQDGATTRRVDQTSKVTMRNEISAMANKIWPNTTGKVPNEYLDAIQAALGWRPGSTDSQTGVATQLQGIWYDLGNVGAGFDNDGDGLPDRNAWMQPVGDPGRYDPLAVRLVKAYGIIIVKLRDGTEKLIPFEDQLYFTNIPENNTGAVGLVYYEFVPLTTGRTAQLSPYQEVASGYDNEKFNGDYGTSVGSFTATAPAATFTKTGPASVVGGGSATYVLSATNTGTTGLGNPNLSLPLIFQDSIPAGLVYIAGSATANNTLPAGNSVSVTWSTDNGTTWVSTEPAAASVTAVRWTLGSALAAGTTATMRFQATIPTSYSSATVDNTGIIKLGTTGEIATSTARTLVTGLNSVGDLVWKDDNRNSNKDVAETGIANITVRLYYDANNDGVLAATDPLFATTTTDANGLYSFASLPDGRFIAVVDSSDTDLPAGYTLPNSATASIAVALDPTRVNASAVSVLTADWPFISALVVAKTASATAYGTGDLVTYTIDLENHAAAVAAKAVPVQTAWSVAVAPATGVTGLSDQNPTNANGQPDQNFARLDWRSSSDFLTTPKPTFADTTGTISKIELVFPAYLSASLTNDTLNITVAGNGISKVYTLDTNTINAMTSPSSLRSIEITDQHGPTAWTWAQVQDLTATFTAIKNSGPDTKTLWVDAIGFRVTTGATTATTGVYGPSSISPLPLVDTYDATKLSYVSASVAPTSVSAGTITWSNLGPLNSGTRRTITVTFRALAPATVAGTTVLNTATSTSPYFVSGALANNASGNVTVAINPRGSIGDLVWVDSNGDGFKDAAEPGLNNVLVSLSNGAQTRTDSTGYYFFGALANGTYTVTVDTNTLPWTTFTQTKDPDGATLDNASTVTVNTTDGLTTNDNYLDRDFGYRSTTLSVISGILFQDNNANGVLDTSESYLSGVTVTLLRDGDANGTFETTVTTTTTNASGFYRFGSLAAGSYRVVVTQPASTIQTLDPDLTPGVTTGDNAVNQVTVAGGFYNNRNFAYKPSGALAIGDTLYYDWNGNGAQDSGDAGISGVSVQLYRDISGDGIIDPTTDALIGTSVTSSSGVYGFSGLPAATYIVKVDTAALPASVTQIQDYDGTRDNQAFVNLTASLATVDFGYKPQGTASIGDAVFIDANGNGLKGSGESGIANVTVTLYRDVNNNGVINVGTDPVVATTTTDSTGAYLFSSLAAGRYLVDVNPGAAAIPTDAYGNKYRSTTTIPHDVTLTVGQAYVNADFGFAASASVGDYVFFDTNGNGTQDISEAGIPGVTVQLFADVNQDGQPDSSTPLTSTVTATGSATIPTGFYQFTNLPAGTYFVKVLTSTLPQVGGQPIALTSDPDRDGVPVNDNTYPSLPAGDNGDSYVIVSLGSNYSGADFGYQPSGALGDFVWLDLDKDGVQDSGEPGIANVLVRITNGTTTYDTTTDLDGRWSVANVPNGNWSVSLPAANFTAGGALQNTVATYDADGGANSSVAITLTAGAVNLGVGNLGLDFGYALNGTLGISGTVLTHDTRVSGTADDVDDFFDDGVDQDAGVNDEVELGNIVIYLYTTGGRLLGSTTTAANGTYQFTGLPSGTYRVIIGTTDAALLNSTLTTTTANNAAVTSVNASSGTSVIQTLNVGASNVTRVDFAFVSNVNYDYGDLPASYGITTLAHDGARHTIPVGGSTLYLGTAPDIDTNGVPTALANGDDILGTDDENGITPLSVSTWKNGTVATANGGSIQANVTGSGWLVGWVDWNHDGTFLDPGELIISQAVVSGSSTISFDIPANTIGASSTSWLSRFRLFTAKPAYPLFSYTGIATNGEVEDLLIEKSVGASIGDLVWIDKNGNGVVETGEDGIGGRVVSLLNGSNGLSVTQTTSDGTQDVDGDGVIDPAGYYRFRGLAAGNYTVTVTNPPAGYAPSYDENGISSANVTSLTLVAAEQRLTADFGYAPMLANIAGQVRYDIDADGDLGDADSGAPGVKVQLWTDPNGDGSPADGVQVGETYTNGTGTYLFSSVATGKYVVVEINAAGSTSTADIDGGNFDRIAVTLTGTNVSGRDFLDTKPPVYAISGTVYDDNNTSNNNLIGGDDTALAGVVVRLFFDRDGNGLFSAGDSDLGSTLTNASGAYAFNGMPAGNYVTQLVTTGVTFEWDAHGTVTDGQIGVALTNANVSGRDFLVDSVTVQALSGVVYRDNGTTPGSFDAGDGGVGGVVVSLYNDINADGVAQAGELVRSSFTIVGGSYIFNGLPNGSYLVVETNPSGATSVNDTQGAPADDKIAATLSGSNSVGNNFLDSGTSFYSISGTVRNDTPEDGALHGNEPGVPGVVVQLRDGSSNVIGSTTTNSAGAYSFLNLGAGSYVVVEVDPAGASSVADSVGANDNQIPVTLVNADVTGRDFLDHVFCPTLWSDWQTLWPLGGQNGTGNDPDGDGYNNLIEYAFCMPPNSGAGDPFCLHTMPDGTIYMEFTRPTGGTQDLTYVLESAPTLGATGTTWTTKTVPTANLIVTPEGDDETVRILDLETVTALTSGKGFVRLRVNLSGGATAVTGVSGWTESALAIHCRTYNNPFVRCATFGGTIDGVAGQSIILNTSAGPLDLGTLLDSGSKYYVEVVSGANEGHRFDVVSASGASVLLATDSDLYGASAPFNTQIGALPSSLTGNRIELRRHWTLAELFPVDGFGATSSSTTADQIMFCSGGVWTTYWLYNDGVGANKWVTVLDPGADQGGTVVPPGQGIFVNPRQTTAPLIALGDVRANRFVRPLDIENNLVGGGYPVDQSPNSRGMTIANGFVGTSNFKTADQFLLWKGDTTPGANGYLTDYLLDGSPTIKRWVKVGDATIASQSNLTLFPSDRSIFIKTVSPRPGYFMPLPWLP